MGIGAGGLQRSLPASACDPVDPVLLSHSQGTSGRKILLSVKGWQNLTQLYIYINAEHLPTQVLRLHSPDVFSKIIFLSHPIKKLSCPGTCSTSDAVVEMQREYVWRLLLPLRHIHGKKLPGKAVGQTRTL